MIDFVSETEGISAKAWVAAVANDVLGNDRIEVHVRGDRAYYSVTGSIWLDEAAGFQAEMDHCGIDDPATRKTWDIVCRAEPR